MNISEDDGNKNELGLKLNMPRLIKGFFNTFRITLMLIPMALVWMLAVMVYFDRFIPPFDRLTRWLIPWKSLYYMPAGAMGERMTYMQDILDASVDLSNITFIILIASFVSFSIYLTFLYQQKQRRSRENQLLLLKNQEIARRIEFIRYISATIGHEFKNNLGRIKRRLDLLTGLPGESRARLDENMNKLFADIEIFKKISDEREALLTDFSIINLRDLLTETAGRFSDLAETDFQDTLPLPAVFASRPLLTTVLETLFDNSIKYKKPQQPLARIKVSCSMDVDGPRSYISISFKDEGIGMDEHQADKCFYKNVESRSGWGQGLYYAKYVIGLHAGKIRVGKDYTAPDRGAEIIINIPFVEEKLYV